MTQSTFKSTIEYYHYVMRMFYQAAMDHFDDQESIKQVKLLAQDRRKRSERGILYTTQPIVFRDGATFTFREEIMIEDGVILRPKYEYKYYREDYYFRYERDDEASLLRDSREQVSGTRRDHPECHLHANRQSPRFMTHATNLEEVFLFILACFYGF